MMVLGQAVSPVRVFGAETATPGDPPPSPTVSAPAQSPLREIGHVRATTPFCKATLETADLGIEIALGNDLRLQDIEGTFRHAQLDRGIPLKAAALQSLRRQYVSLRAATVAGDGVMKQLKSQAAGAPTPEQAKAMASFADALAGALFRQKTLADTVGRAVVILENHPMITDEEHDRSVQSAIRQGGGYNSVTIDNGAHSDDDQDALVTRNMEVQQGALNRGMRNATNGYEGSVLDTGTALSADVAGDIEARSKPILKDEGTASDRLDAAFNGC